jgi:hypothetical protein
MRILSTKIRKNSALKLLLILSVMSFAAASCTVLYPKNNTSEKHADFYVSPNGNDADSGAFNAPFATLEHARGAVRQLKKTSNKDILVYLRGGRYPLHKTVLFTLDDSGDDSRTITYAAYPGEYPVFTAGEPIGNWKKPDKIPTGLSPETASKVWAADLPGGLDHFYTLYDGQVSLPRARGKGFAPTNEELTGDNNTLKFPCGTIKNYANLHDVEILIRPTYGWTINILPIDSVDENACTAVTSIPSTYLISYLWGKKRSDNVSSVWVENTFECLNEPGNWVLDSAARKIYLWPREDKPSSDIVAPRLTELIRIEGVIDYNGPADRPVKNLVFRGLTFTQGDRYTWEKDHGGWGLQHDWEMFDRPSALFRLRGAEKCTVDSCRFTNAGGTGIRLDLWAKNNHIINNKIDYIGGAGILLAGYGPGTKDVNRDNEISNNYIHHIGRLYWQSPAIFIWQSGENRVANNLIHNTPYTAIVVSGRIVWDRTGKQECSKTVRWHEVDKTIKGLSWYEKEPFLHGRNNIIERNEIHDVMEILEDGNCIYVSGTGKGNIIRENYLHHNLSPNMESIIRSDDDQHQTTIESNIIYCNNGNGIAIKGINNIVNNIIANLRLPQARYISLEVEPPTGAFIQRNILYSHQKDQVLYGEGLFYGTGEVPRLRNTKADYNLYYSSIDSNWGKSHLVQERAFGIEQNSISADPLFVDLDQGNFQFREGSPAVKLGFKPIDVTLIGLKR